MKNRYSKKQIQEAINYWQNILVQMNESKSKLLDICSSKFTEDVVFTDKEYKFALNNENIQNLFEILNSFLFKGMLSKVPKLNLFIGSPVELNPKILECI